MSNKRINILLWVFALVLLATIVWANRDYSLIPNTSDMYDLGSSTHPWRTTYTDFADVGKIQADVVVQPTYTATALTSPTVTIDVSASSYYTITTDENQIGITFTGGALGQLVYFRTGAGENTLRLDDGTSMSLGGSDITFTEGHDDVGCLRCVDEDGDEWERVFISNDS